MPPITIRITRRLNFELLLLDYSQAKIARRYDAGASFINQLKREKRNIGDKTARKLEKTLGKPDGWMDTPHEDEWCATGVSMPEDDRINETAQVYNDTNIDEIDQILELQHEITSQIMALRKKLRRKTPL